MLKKRSLSLLLTAALLFSTVMMLSAEPASAASKKTYYLPEKVTVYSRQDNSWKKWYTNKYTYNSKGDITKYQEESGYGVSKVKWTYSKGKPVKAVVTSEKLPDFTTTLKFDKKGRVSQLTTVEPYNGKTGKFGRKYTYNAKGYAKKVTLINFNREKDTYSFTYHKNGMAKKIKGTGYTYYCNSNGLVTSDSSGYTYEYTYDKKGRVKSAVKYEKENGKKVGYQKEVYTYGKAKTTDRMKYVSMMSKAVGRVSGHPFPYHIYMN